MSSDPLSHYAELGVDPSATAAEIKAIYKALLKLYHPDVAAPGISSEKVRRINEAFAVLGDEDKRKSYDGHGSYRARREEPRPEEKPRPREKPSSSKRTSFSPDPPDPQRDRFHGSSSGSRRSRGDNEDLRSTHARRGSSDKASAQYDIEKKHLWVAYLLWAFLGYTGAHRFYLGKHFSGAMMLLVSIVILILGLATLGLLLVLYAMVAVWWAVDALLIPGIANEYNTELADGIFR